MDGKWKDKKLNGSVCQNNFVLTEPYTVQKTPAWNLTASTDTLKKFKQVDGSKLIQFSNYLDWISTTEYNKNASVDSAMKNFINKYKKLAVEVDIKNSKFLEKSNNNVSVSKVPGKDIYFVDGNITIKWWTTNILKPFTIVQTNGSATIRGNVGHNMMLLTEKNITFEGDCTSNQIVKWVFYAWWVLAREWVDKNDDLKATHKRCDMWWLYIKWVLIWGNFDKMMERSRSHLETWFDINGKTAKNIMNWASVLIEYSPSVFTKSSMPPGAEDFTTALSIYKQ